MNDAASPQTFCDTNALIYLGQFQGLLPMKNLLKPICIKLPMYLDSVMNQLIEKTIYTTIFSLNVYIYIYIYFFSEIDDVCIYNNHLEKRHDCMPFHTSETTEQKTHNF